MAAPAVASVWLMHGQPDSSATWLPARRRLSERLSTAGIELPEVRVLDRPGYGRNPAAPTDYRGNVAWLRSELDRTGTERVVLLGHSWAGGVAILAAVADPRVTGVVLAASVGPGCLVPSDQLLAAPVVGDLLAFAGLRLGRSLLRSAIRHRLGPGLHVDDYQQARTAAFGNLNRPMWRSFLVEQRSLLRDLTRIEAALPEITVPTLVVSGRRDTVIPAATTAALTERIGPARRVDLEAGHDLNLAAPVGLADAVADWLIDLP